MVVANIVLYPGRLYLSVLLPHFLIFAMRSKVKDLIIFSYAQQGPSSLDALVTDAVCHLVGLNNILFSNLPTVQKYYIKAFWNNVIGQLS